MNGSHDSQQQFNALAANYAASSVHRDGPSLPALVRLAQPVATDVVLDVATGTGHTALRLAPLVKSVVGVDVADGMLQQARDLAAQQGAANVSFQNADAQQLPFADASFSLVVARHAPHHFRDADHFLSEVARVLTPSGRFVLADQVSLGDTDQAWVDQFQRLRDPSHFTQRTPDQWFELAAAHGLDPKGLAFGNPEGQAFGEVVPYVLPFEWWVSQAGAEAVRLELVELLRSAPASVEVVWNADDEPESFVEPILVARFDLSPLAA
ncbi:MAG: class I SAM-dependent methyltransferase [Thermoleophilaceae bacterium]|nr:class I SAM-dependent methyltransferase [Thermoleophilaceae bacterium]